MTETELNGLRREIMIAYGFLLASIIGTITPLALPVCLAIFLCVTGYAYYRDDAMRDTIYATHLRWIVRTFWLGVFVYFPLMTLITTALCLSGDYTAVTQALGEGEKNGHALMTIYIQHNAELMTRATFIVSGIYWFWLLYRGLWGFGFAIFRRPVARVTSWL